MVLHGRDEARHRIDAVLAEVLDGRGQALAIRGAAGVGKSALLAAAATVVGAGRAKLLRGSGVESEVELAFSGLHQLLEPLTAHQELLPEAQAAALRYALGTAVGQTNELLVYAAVLNLLRQAARSRPLVIVVDDAQHIDHASLAALLFAGRRLAGSAVGLLLAVRDPGRRTVDTSDLPELRLAGLSRDAAARLLDGLGWAVDGAILDTLVQATGGNPLALTELANRGEREQLAVDALLTGTVPVDSALRDVFGGRVSSLPPVSGHALLVAAAEDSGRHQLVRAACARLDLPADALEAARLAGLIEFADDEVRFAHPLIRSAVYSAAPAGRRREAHAAVADELAARRDMRRERLHRALATDGPDDQLATALEADAQAVSERGGIAATASLLGHAARLSANPSDRDRRTVAAGHAAWKSGNVTLARSFLERQSRAPGRGAGGSELTRLRGLVELDTGEQTSAYDYLNRNAESLSGPMPEQAAELFFMAAGAAFQANRIDLATAAARRIAELAVEPAYQRYGRWLARSLADEPDESSADPWRVVALAPAAIQRSAAHRWLFPLAISWRGPNPLRAREFALAAYRELAASGMRAMIGIPLPWLIELDYQLGWWDEGIAHADEGLRTARELGQRPRVADFLSLRALFAAARGAEADCRRDAEQALQAALPLRNQLAAAQATWALGALELARGEHERASERLATLRTPGLPQAHEHIARQAAADAVEAAVRAGDIEQATLVVDDFARWVGRTGRPWAQAQLHRCRALLADDAADPHFQLALSTAGAEARPYEHARTALLYGQWLRRNRLSRQARVPLRLATELFDSLGARQWAERARGELLACGAAALRVGTAAIAGLTAQELQVARLAATGLSNREIAAQLFLSPRTVGYHLHKVFPKLGISTRSQLRHCQLPSYVGG